MMLKLDIFYSDLIWESTIIQEGEKDEGRTAIVLCVVVRYNYHHRRKRKSTDRVPLFNYNYDAKVLEEGWQRQLKKNN